MKVNTTSKHQFSGELKLQNFRAEGLDVELFAVSPADAAAEAFANKDNQVYFGKGHITLREGACDCGQKFQQPSVVRGGSSSKSEPRQKQRSHSSVHAQRDASAVFDTRTCPSTAGDVVLDCGANVGSFARMAAPVLGPRGTVYCLEPIPDVWAALKLNASIYQRWADKNGLQVARVVPIQAGADSSAACTALQRVCSATTSLSGPLSQQRHAPASHVHLPHRLRWSPAGVAAEGSLPEREFAYYPRLTAMSSMYPDEADAAQVCADC
jgi:hypothetical protein